MQDSGLGKEAVKALKHHDNFLTELRLLVEKDQDNLRQDIDDKIQLTQIVVSYNKISKAVGEIQKKKDYIASLESDILGYRAMEEDFESLKAKHQHETLRSNDMASELTELQSRSRELLDEVNQLTRAMEVTNKKRADIQSVVDEVVPKYEALRSEHLSTKEELENKIGKLEDQLNSALHREEVFKEKWRRADEDCEKYKAEADARGLKVEYLENKLEEKYHVENLFSQLKEDYEDLRREKQSTFETVESRLIQKEEELRKAGIERDEV